MTHRQPPYTDSIMCRNVHITQHNNYWTFVEWLRGRHPVGLFVVGVRFLNTPSVFQVVRMDGLSRRQCVREGATWISKFFCPYVYWLLSLALLTFPARWLLRHRSRPLEFVLIKAVGNNRKQWRLGPEVPRAPGKVSWQRVKIRAPWGFLRNLGQRICFSREAMICCDRWVCYIMIYGTAQ